MTAVRYCMPRRFLGLCFCFLPLFCLAQEPRTVTVAINHAPPYRIVTDEGVTGLYVDTFNEIARRMGWQVRYVEAPFRRVLYMMRTGAVDVMLGPLKSEDRQEIMAFVAPVFPPEPKLFFYHKDEHRITAYDDLRGKKIGVLSGARYFEPFDSDTGLVIETASRYENLMKMLEKGRVDVVLAPELVGRHTIKELGIAASVSPFQVAGERSYIAISLASPVLDSREEIKSMFEAMKAEGIYDRLVSDYQDRASQ
jgi:polar amino acid transport system substrate-binding protein